MTVVTTIAVMKMKACVERLASGGPKPLTPGLNDRHGLKMKESIAAGELSGQFDLLKMPSIKTKALVDILT